MPPLAMPCRGELFLGEQLFAEVTVLSYTLGPVNRRSIEVTITDVPATIYQLTNHQFNIQVRGPATEGITFVACTAADVNEQQISFFALDVLDEEGNSLA
jgi:hypothetical protein